MIDNCSYLPASMNYYYLGCIFSFRLYYHVCGRKYMIFTLKKHTNMFSLDGATIPSVPLTALMNFGRGRDLDN